MGGGTGAGGQDPRWLKILRLQDEVTALLEEIKDHAPTVEDYGVHYPRRPKSPPKPPERIDPGVPIREGSIKGFCLMLWDWIRR